MGGVYSTHDRDEKCIQFSRSPKGKRPLGRPRRIWAVNIRMELREIESQFVDLIHLAQDKDQW